MKKLTIALVVGVALLIGTALIPRLRKPTYIGTWDFTAQVIGDDKPFTGKIIFSTDANGDLAYSATANGAPSSTPPTTATCVYSRDDKKNIMCENPSSILIARLVDRKHIRFGVIIPTERVDIVVKATATKE